MSKKIFVTGLPRAGSTLLCQLLAEHPDVACDVGSSPLANQLESLRSSISDDPFMLSRLDKAWDANYDRLKGIYRGMIDGWTEGWHGKRAVVDKNRGWLRMLEFVSQLVPDSVFLICIRDLTQVLGSIEATHEKTLMLDYPDHAPHHSRYARADVLFAPNGIVGAPLGSIHDYEIDVADERLKSKCYYVAYEALVGNPIETMQHVYQFVGLDPFEIDPGNLTVHDVEADSWYRMKFPHKTRGSIDAAKATNPYSHNIPARIEKEIIAKFEWYYRMFYPATLEKAGDGNDDTVTFDATTNVTDTSS